jgi:hypothetical protein
MPEPNAPDLLRECLAEPPSELAFRSVCALLERSPGTDGAMAFEGAERALATWPDETRVAPWSWAQALKQGRTRRTWDLVRAVALRSEHLGKTSVDLASIAGRPELRRVSSLRLDVFDQGIDGIEEVSSRWLALRSVRIRDSRGAIEERAALPMWSRLAEIHIGELGDDLFHRGAASLVPVLSTRDRLEAVTLPAEDLVRLWKKGPLPRLRSADVFVRSLDEAEDFAARRELAQLEHLGIAFRCGHVGKSPSGPFPGNVVTFDDVAARRFFATAHLPRLRSLRIVGKRMGYWGREGIGPAGIEALVASGLLGQLHRIRLELLPLGDDGLAPVIAGLANAPLDRLELVDLYARDRTARALSEVSAFRRIERLDLSANRISTEGATVLARARGSQLREIDLSGPQRNPYYWHVGDQVIGDSGARAWLSGENGVSPVALRLASNGLTDAVLPALAESRALAGLQRLDLSHNAFTASGIEALCLRQEWPSLRALTLDDVRLDDRAVSVLTASLASPRLRELDLRYNCIGPDGVERLARWPLLASLWRLQLHDNFIGDAGLKALAESRHAYRLLELDVEQDCWNARATTFGDEAAKAMARSNSLPNLEALFAGLVDEYHGASYSKGFSSEGWNELLGSGTLRPELVTALRAVKVDEEVEVTPASPTDAQRWESDFRSHPPEPKDPPDGGPLNYERIRVQSQ